MHVAASKGGESKPVLRTAADAEAGSLPAAMADPLGCCAAVPRKAAALGSVPVTRGASLAAA